MGGRSREEFEMEESRRDFALPGNLVAAANFSMGERARRGDQGRKDRPADGYVGREGASQRTLKGAKLVTACLPTALECARPAGEYRKRKRKEKRSSQNAEFSV